MTERLTERQSKTPGPREVVRLDIASASLPDLLNGIHPERCWLQDHGDGLYSFHATQTYGESRKQAGTPAKDILVELLNDFGEQLNDVDVPQWLRESWDAMVATYIEHTAPNPSRPASSVNNEPGAERS